MFFKKNKKESRLKKVDKLVTGIIIAGAVAGAIGLSKTEKGKKIISKTKNTEKIKKLKGLFSKSYEVLGKVIVKGVSIFDKKK